MITNKDFLLLFVFYFINLFDYLGGPFHLLLYSISTDVMLRTCHFLAKCNMSCQLYSSFPRSLMLMLVIPYAEMKRIYEFNFQDLR